MKNLKVVFAVIFCSFISLNFTFADAAFGTNLSGSFTIQQKSNSRYVDAYDYQGTDYSVVSRPNQKNNTQRWIFTKVGYNTFTIQQKSTGRYLDAYDYDGTDYKVALRPSQGNNTQKWIIKKVGSNSFTIQQKSTSRYLDAHEYAGKDYALVTRPAQKNNTQQWILKRVTSPRKELSAINKAVKASIFGSGIKGKKIFGHKFNFGRTTSVNINKRTGVKTVYLKLDHVKSYKFDDKYYFKATFNKNNELLTWEYKINRGGYLPKTSSSIGATRFKKTAKGYSPVTIDKLAAKAKRNLKGNKSWEKAAKEIAMIIAKTAVSYKK